MSRADPAVAEVTVRRRWMPNEPRRRISFYMQPLSWQEPQGSPEQ
jgi:hypothetical protein